MRLESPHGQCETHEEVQWPGAICWVSLPPGNIDLPLPAPLSMHIAGYGLDTTMGTAGHCHSSTGARATQRAAVDHLDEEPLWV